MKELVELFQALGPILAAIATIGAFFIHSPLGSKLPKWLVTTLMALSSDTVQETYAILSRVALGPEERRKLAVEYLVKQTAGTDLALSENDAGRLCDFIRDNFDKAAGYVRGVTKK